MGWGQGGDDITGQVSCRFKLFHNVSAPERPSVSSVSPSKTPPPHRACGRGLHVDPGEGVGSGGGDVGLGGVEGYVVDGLLALLTVSSDLLNTRLTVQVPQTQGAVVTWGAEHVRVQVNRAIDWLIDWLVGVTYCQT